MPSVDTIVFKSAKKNDFYLYLKADSEFESLPMELRHSFGTPIFVMDLTIDEQRSLARADTLKVLSAHLKRMVFIFNCRLSFMRGGRNK